MTISNKFVTWALFSAFFAFATSGCGGTALEITPAGPVTVQKGQTQQFSSNLPDTTWSVDGGNANGTIDASGLYTPPTTLPVSAQAVVRAMDADGQEDTAGILLQTGAQIAFDPATRTQINQTAIGQIGASLGFVFGTSNNFDVREGSLKTSTIWNNLDDNGTPSDNSDDEVLSLYSQDVDFLGFSPERELFRAPISGISTVVGSMVLDGDLNPSFLGIRGILIDSEFADVLFFGSTDGGTNFNSVPVNPTAPVSDESRIFPSMGLASSGTFHVTYLQQFQMTEQFSVRYTRSTDGGATWEPKELTPLSTDPADFAPTLAVSPNSETLAVCWMRVTDPMGTGATAVQLSVSQDGGDNFSSPIGIDIATIGSSSPPLCAVSIAPDGKIYLLYPQGSDIGFARSDDNGGSFVVTKTINQDPTNTELSLVRSAVDGNGRIDAVWLANLQDDPDDTPESVIFARSTDLGESFAQTPIPLNLPQTTIALPAGLTHDESGRLHFEFFSNNNNPEDSFDLYSIRAE